MNASRHPVFLAVRPLDRRDVTQAAFSELAIDLIFTSVIDYHAAPHNLPPAQMFTGLIVTSSRAVIYAHDQAKIYHDLPLYVVGEQTAACLRDQGFTRIAAIAPNVHALLPALPRAPLLYLRGDEVSVDITAAASVPVTSVMTYQSIPKTSLEKDIIEKITQHEIDGVLLFSPKITQVFVGLLNHEKLGEKTRTLSALCLSERVLKCASYSIWARTIVAPQPDLAGMVEAARSYLRAGERG